MSGGELEILIAPDFAITMTGPVTGVAQGTLAPDIFGA
jgi:diaminopimelate epimerase